MLYGVSRFLFLAPVGKVARNNLHLYSVGKKSTLKEETQLLTRVMKWAGSRNLFQSVMFISET